MDILEDAQAILEQLRAGPAKRIHCIVGEISITFTNQVLAAINFGASMTNDVREVGDLVERAGAVLVQVASLSDLIEAGMNTAVE